MLWLPVLSVTTRSQRRSRSGSGQRDTAPKGGCEPKVPKPNITDPQSQMMRLRGGAWVQGYNCQAATGSDGLLIAISVDNNPK
jgi:hypothetical protein